MLAVVPWVIDFIVDSGWAQEIVRFQASALTHCWLKWSLAPKLITIDQPDCDCAGHWERCEHLGLNEEHFLHLKTFSALLSRFRHQIEMEMITSLTRALKANVAGKPGRERGAKGQWRGAHMPGQH